MSVWCVFCSRAVPSTKWLPVCWWHIMADVTASQPYVAQKRVNEGVGRTFWMIQTAWLTVGGWEEAASLLSTGKELHFQPWRGWAVCCPHLSGHLRALSIYSEANSHSIPRDHFSIRTIKDRWLSLPVLEKTQDVKERWKWILWGLKESREMILAPSVSLSSEDISYLEKKKLSNY